MKGVRPIKALLLFLLLLFFEAFGDSDVSIAPMDSKEQEALYSMIQGFVGKPWNGSGLYPDPCGWTPIQGISCDIFNDLWYITTVSIGPILENSLECSHDAEFSPFLFELKHLKSLTFFNCFSSPITIPSNYWDKLSQSLDTLEFRSNKGLIGEIPPILGQLKNLQSLVLVENSLSGKLPQEFGNLFQLKRLTLSGNEFSGPIPNLGNNLVELLILDLSRNSLSGPLHSSLGAMTSLLKLDVSDNALSGKVPNELGDLRNLTLLDLRNNNLSGGLTRSLEGMVSIQDMLLSNNPMGGNLIEFQWERLVNLTNLDLSNTSLLGEIPESIARLKRLRFLALDNNHLSGSISTKLESLPCLNALYLHRNNFSGEIGFSEKFYERMGRRFASGDNPSLCYRTEHGPSGVEKCKNEQEEVSRYDFESKTKVGRENPDQNSTELSSFGFSASCLSGVLWQILMEVAIVLVLML